MLAKDFLAVLKNATEEYLEDYANAEVVIQGGEIWLFPQVRSNVHRPTAICIGIAPTERPEIWRKLWPEVETVE